MKDLLRLLRLFVPWLPWLLLGVLLSFATLLANVALMALSGWFISAMALAGAAGASMNYFTPAALIRAAAIVRTAGRYAERLVTHEATFRLLAELRVWFYRRLEPLAPALLENYRSGDLLSRIRADIDTLDHVYLRLLVPAAVALLATTVFVAVLWRYHPLLALAEGSLMLVAGLGVPWLVNRLGRAAGRRKVEVSAELRAALVTDVQGMGELLVYGAAPRHAEHMDALAQELARRQRTLSGLHGLSQGALGLCANLAMWAMLVLAIPMVSAHTLAPPALAMLALFALAGFEAVMPLPQAMQALGEALAAARRVFALADSAPAVTEPADPLPVPQTLRFEFHKVDFRYRPDAAPALRDVSLTLAPGRKLAVVGATGSGKSTLAGLLARFRDPDSGELLLNGAPLARYDGETLRAHIALLTQQTHLFNTSIRDNLLLARPDAGQEALEQVCRVAMIHDFIRAQPDGYDTVTGETGVRLSGGQARRVAIARTLLKDAAILILDEPTEGIDPETAGQIMANIMDRVESRQQALLLISHRLQGLERMDEIVVMVDGQVAESGSHQALLAAQGHYRQLHGAI
ncbi:MAG: thiol reductant ABC exporter subunit CydC [Thiogranum sp.]|jgi:ATP-binding cassette subfamily C protein CydC